MKTAFTHCALHVEDLDASVAFYRDYCGLKAVGEHGEGPNDHAVWMSEDGRETDYVFVLLLGGQGHAQPESDLSHFGFAVGSRSDGFQSRAATRRPPRAREYRGRRARSPNGRQSEL